MDPDANLEEQLRIAERLLATDGEEKDAVDEALRLAELVEALNGWISKGGFLPAKWRDR